MIFSIPFHVRIEPGIMRKLALILFSALCVQAWSQGSSIFLHVRPDATVLVQKHSTGADMVEITMRDPQYPLTLLEAQSNTICSLLGAPARGLSVVRDSIGGSPDPNFAVTRATFATDGIIEPDGALRIEPFLKALAGAPAPFTIQGVDLNFEALAPNARTVQQLSLPGVLDAEARYTPDGVLKGIEYRVELLTQDPDKITFPDHYQPSAPLAPPVLKSPNSPILTISLIVLAGIAAGALVYFGMLRNGSRSRP